jgi:hypothetical protein
MSHAPERTPLLASEYPGALASSQHAAHAAAAMSSAAAADLERQRDEDEAFARRLAEQERADPSYQAAEGQQSPTPGLRLKCCLSSR